MHEVVYKMSDRRPRERKSRSRSPVNDKKEPANEQKELNKEPPVAEKPKEIFAIDREKVCGAQ